MQSNNTFCWGRFSKYFVWDLKRCWSVFGLNLAILAVVPLITAYLACNLITFFAHNYRIGFDCSFSIVVMYMTMLCIGAAMPARCYGHMTERVDGQFWPAIPASVLERTVSMVVICSLALISGTAGYVAIDALIGIADPEYEYYILNPHSRVFASVDIFPLILFLSGIAFTYIWGAVFFKRVKIAWTSLIIMALAVALWLLLMLCSNLFVVESDTTVLSAFILLFAVYDALMLYLIYRRMKTIKP